MTSILPSPSKRIEAGARALEPVSTALRLHAEADATALVEAARQRASNIRARGAAEADAIIESARAEGDAQARAVASIELARARRLARAMTLAAQRELYDECRRRTREAAQRLRSSPDYPELERHLAALARARLGPEAIAQPVSTGGVIAVAGSRRLDLSLDSLADRAVDSLGPQVEQLWA